MPDQRPNVVGVRLRNAGKILYFHSAGMRLEAGEYVVVETVRGPELAKVVIAPDQVVVNEMGREELKPILRLATDDDIRKMDGLRTRAQELLTEARQMAGDAGFPAHIDGADFTLDGRRLTFSFTSEDRLDYGAFLRRAGDRFGARVDMRQMGPRDRARQAGGYGICGRELCCSNWLTSFPSISIRMAKEQELPLNPQKISGLCGRLLCCLSYEEAGYKEMRKTLPRLGQRCSTPTGEGRAIAVNILRRQVTLIVDGQRVEVGDRDLGTVVRWDPASKIGDPPPSLTRAEAVAQGLLTAEEAAEVDLDALPADLDWITGERMPTQQPGVGRGRLPGGGPRKTGGRPKQDTPRPDGPPPAGRPERGPARPQGQRQPRPQPGQQQGGQQRGDRPPGRPPGPAQGPLGGQVRTFTRSDGPTPPGQSSARPPQDPPPTNAVEPDPDGAAPRRRNRGRGGRGGPPPPE